MGYNWHWRVLFETEPGGTGSYLHYLIVGLGWTLATALAAWVLALVIGSIVGTVRTTRSVEVRSATCKSRSSATCRDVQIFLLFSWCRL